MIKFAQTVSKPPEVVHECAEKLKFQISHHFVIKHGRYGDWIGISTLPFSLDPLQYLPSRLHRSCKKSPKNPTIYVCLPKLARDEVFCCVGSPGVFITPGTYHIYSITISGPAQSTKIRGCKIYCGHTKSKFQGDFCVFFPPKKQGVHVHPWCPQFRRPCLLTVVDGFVICQGRR